MLEKGFELVEHCRV